MAELKWKEAIQKVLEEEKKSLHYTVIAELIAERGYRRSLGATPQDTVSANLTTDINTNKEKSIFAKVDRGYYILRKFLDDSSQLLTDDEEIKGTETISETKPKKESYKIINAFGIYWNRNLVHWKTTPDLLGIQQIGASEVNFKSYVLGILFYRFISENLTSFLNKEEQRAGNTSFDYTKISDKDAEFGRADIVADLEGGII